MRAKTVIMLVPACVLVAIDLAVSPIGAGQKLKPEEIVARHLAAIGTDEARAWPLLDVAGRQPKLKAAGVQRIEGQELLRLDYTIRKGGGDGTIQLFFDPVSFQHVRSVYTYTRMPAMGRTPDAAAQSRDEQYELEERFGEFKTFDGITLPTRWSLRYTSDTTARPVKVEWGVLVESVTHKPPFDATTFVITPRK